MSIMRRAARGATYRIARRGGIAALLILLGSLWASRTPPAPRQRLGTREEYMTGRRLRGRHTVKVLAEHVYRNPDDLIASVDLAQAVLEHIAREEQAP